MEINVFVRPVELMASITPWWPRLAVVFVVDAVLVDEMIVQPLRALR